MSSPVNLRAIIGVMDRASAPLRHIGRGFAGMDLRARLAMINLNRLGRAAGLSQLVAQMGRAGRAAMALGAKVKGIVVNLGALAGIGALGGLGGILRGFSSTGDEIARLAKRAGMGVVAFQELRHAAHLADIEDTLFNTSLSTLVKNMADASSGKNAGLAELFQRLHINLKNADGSLRNVDDILPSLADGFKRNTNATVRQAMAIALFGQEGVAMIDMLGEGSAALAKQREEARKYGILTEEQIKQASLLDTGFKHVTMAVTGLWQEVGSRLAPAVTPLLEMFGDWVALNRAVISANVAEAVKSIADAIRGFDWVGFGRALLSIGRTVNTLAGWIGGWKNVMIGVVALINASLLLSLGKLVYELAMVGKVALIASARLGGMAFAAAASAMLNFVTALRAGYGAMAALNLVMAANPIGALIVGVTALIAFGTLLYQKWKPFRDLIQWIVGAAKWLVGVKNPWGTSAGKGATAAAEAARNRSASRAFTAYGRGRGMGGRGSISPITGMSGRGQPQKARIEATIDFKNVPQGVKTDVKTAGVDRQRQNVGRAMVMP